MQEGDELLVITQQGMILRMQTDDVRAIGRATQGVRLIDIEDDDQVVSIARLVEKEEEEPAADAGMKLRACCWSLRSRRRRRPAAPRPEAADPQRVLQRSRLRDRTALQKIATTSFDPAAHGIITSFDITGVVTGEAAGRAIKDVSISAPVKLPDGQTVQKDLVVTLERDGSASGSAAERWIVTAIRDARGGSSPPPR